MNFELLDHVQWKSSSNGTTKTKHGQIEAIIPANTEPGAEQRKEADAYGLARDHTSYLVRVAGTGVNAKGRLFWPRTSKLVFISRNRLPE